MSKDFETKDSGSRRDFPTGARRDLNKGKGRYDLLPAVCVERLAKLYERGAVKYGDNNWQKGIPSTCYMESALRHLFRYLDGHRDEDHLAAAVFNVFGLIWNEEVTVNQNDMPGQRQKQQVKIKSVQVPPDYCYAQSASSFQCDKKDCTDMACGHRIPHDFAPGCPSVKKYPECGKCMLILEEAQHG